MLRDTNKKISIYELIYLDKVGRKHCICRTSNLSEIHMIAKSKQIELHEYRCNTIDEVCAFYVEEIKYYEFTDYNELDECFEDYTKYHLEQEEEQKDFDEKCKLLLEDLKKIGF